MKYSKKLSDTIHCLAFIYMGEKEHLTSTKIAESVKTNPGYIRQLMSALKKAGLISNTQGQANACLTRPADQITMLDIYRAAEGNKPLLHLDVDTNPDCGIGIHVQLAIGDFYEEIQKTAEQKMNEITLQDIIDRYHKKIACAHLTTDCTKF